MKHISLGVVAVSALLLAAPLRAAGAADMAVKAPPPPAATAPAPTWTGWYLGANGGWGGDADPHNIVISTNLLLGGYPATTGGTQARGGLGGVTFGYNWQRDNIVFGVESDFDAASIRNSFQGRVIDLFGDALTAQKALTYVSTIRGRLGLAFNSVLVFGTGGFAFGGVHNGVVDVLTVPPTGIVPMDRNDTQTGYAVGGGIEYMIAPRWSLKAEYQYIRLGGYTLSSPEIPPSAFVFSSNKLDNDFHTVRAGVNLHW